MGTLRNHWTLAAALTVGLVWSLPAAADTCCRGFYVSLKAVYSWGLVDDVTSTGTTTGPLSDKEYFDDSMGGGGMAFGYDFSYLFDAAIRVEGEFIQIARLDADATRPLFNDGSLPGVGIHNNMSIRTLMANVFYDWDFGTWYTPHVGFGVGYSRNNSNATLTDFNQPAATRENEVSTERENLVWSLMAGLQFDIADNWFADAGYRYLDAGEMEMGPFANGVRIESDDITLHEFVLDFGYRF